MHNAIPSMVAALIAVGIIVIGCFHLISPERILGTFGLKPPASDADTRLELGRKAEAPGQLVPSHTPSLELCDEARANPKAMWEDSATGRRRPSGPATAGVFNPQFEWSCMTCAVFGSPRSSCKLL